MKRVLLFCFVWRAASVLGGMTQKLKTITLLRDALSDISLVTT